MRFYEFESKQLFGKHGIPLPKGSRVAHSRRGGERDRRRDRRARWC